MKREIENKSKKKVIIKRQDECLRPSIPQFSVFEIIRATNGKLIAGSDDLSVSGVSTDTRTLSRGNLFIAIRGKNFDGHNFINQAIVKGAQAIIVESDFRFDASQGASRINKDNLSLKDCASVSFIRTDDAIGALCNLAAFHRRRFKIPVVGITGSCGKTTTKEMVADVLSAKFNVLKNKGTFNNSIGVSHTLLRLNKEVDIAVVEMGTSNFGEIKRLAEIVAPSIGIITNVGYSHLEFFKTIDSICNEKYDLVKNLKHPFIAILNGDDMRLRKKAKTSKDLNLFTFGLKKTCDFTATNIECARGVLEFSLNKKHRFKINVLGRQNAYNVLAAISCGVIFGLNYKDIKNKLSAFIMPSTRISLKKIRGYHVIDDTYNSNPLSLEYAIQTLSEFDTKGKKVFVMGDMLELGKRSVMLHREIAKKIIKSGIDTLITVGPLSHHAADAIKTKKRSNLKVYSCGCTLEARGILLNLLRDDDLVLVKGSRGMRMEEIIEDL